MIRPFSCFECLDRYNPGICGNFNCIQFCTRARSQKFRVLGHQDSRILKSPGRPGHQDIRISKLSRTSGH
ncbi:hypothetical protein V1477_013747 [Vespula maculifrons]|uniref:Uncharacterized protein n=1 Tax=Vespula maculifrons TaxID=7453 RepID=A0ABD2BP54_VESMC